MKLTDRTQQFPIPWANMPESGTFSPIPKDDPGDGSASLLKGFPKATMTPIAAGGKPPRGDQFNGIFNQLSLSAQNNDVGVIPAWNADFSQEIGGYPLTAQVTIIKNGMPDILVSICDNNLDNPNNSNQKNWISIRAGLQPAANYQPSGYYVGSIKDAANGDLGCLSLVWSNGWGRPLSFYGSGTTQKTLGLLTTLDLNSLQPKGSYVPNQSKDDGKNKPIGWMGIANDDGRLAFDDTSGKYVKVANHSDLQAYQPAGNYLNTNNPNTAPDFNGDIGIQSLVYHKADGLLLASIPKNDNNTFLGIGLPIGTILMHSTYNIPYGFLQLAGQSFDKTKYAQLFKILGTNVLPDYRGRFPRGAKGSWINVPEIGNYQSDTIRNITGWANSQSPWPYISDASQMAGGAMSWRQSDGLGPHGRDGGSSGNIHIDASTVVPTDWENRPLSVISNFIIKAQ